MLVAIGPGVDAAQDYTTFADFRTLKIKQVQGDTLDTLDVTIHDPTSSWPINAEDDIFVLDETDPTGWPTTNLLTNPGFENGYYASGNSSLIGNGWAVNAIPTGAQWYDSTLVPIKGNHAQYLRVASVAASTSLEINQVVALSTDETGDAIRNPMCLSGWTWIDPAFVGTGSTVTFAIDWLDVNVRLISTTQQAITIAAGTVGNWFRTAVKNLVAPVNAFSAKVRIIFVVGAANLTGFLFLDSLQLEYQTFSAASVASPSVPVRNSVQFSSFTATSNHLGDDWWGSATTGMTLSDLSAPVLNSNRSQGITIANIGTGAQAYIYQGANGGYELPINPKAQYTARMTYQIVTALTASQSWFEVNCFDAANNLLAFYVATGLVGEPASGGGSSNWKQLLIPLGPGTANPIPAGTATVQLLCGLQSTNATNSGAIAIGQVDCLITAQSLQPLSSSAFSSAKVAGMYPSPYCDQLQAGCLTDRLTGLYYRHFRLFAGYARLMTYDYVIEPESDIKIAAVDYSVILQEAPCTLLIKAQNDNLSIKAACDYAFNQGYLQGLDYVTFVQNVSKIDAMLFNWKTTRDAISEIANHTVSAYWVDYHRNLHYAPALAITAPFALSDHPDMIATFPMERWQYADDSTQSETTPVVEGSTQLSAGQTFTGSGNGSNKVFLINGNPGNPVAQIDSCTVGGVGQTVGLANVNTFAQGYNVLLDPTNGTMTFNVAPPSGTNNVVVVFRFTTPVIVRLHWPPAEAKKPTGPFIKQRRHGKIVLIRRKVHKHHSHPHITSQQAAIDQANAHLAQSAQPKPTSTAWIRTPPVPVASTIRPGMAIPITHGLSGLVGVLFQIVEITIRPMGNGQIIRELGMGHYRPDFMIYMMHVNRRTISDSSENTGTPLSDVLSVQDGWAITDSVRATTAMVGVWGSPTPSTWGGTFTWG